MTQPIIYVSNSMWGLRALVSKDDSCPGKQGWFPLSFQKGHTSACWQDRLDRLKTPSTPHHLWSSLSSSCSGCEGLFWTPCCCMEEMGTTSAWWCLLLTTCLCTCCLPNLLTPALLLLKLLGCWTTTRRLQLAPALQLPACCTCMGDPKRDPLYDAVESTRRRCLPMAYNVRQEAYEDISI